MTRRIWGVSEIQNGRMYMEDRWCATYNSGHDLSITGVFDGHNGFMLANRLAVEVPRRLSEYSTLLLTGPYVTSVLDRTLSDVDDAEYEAVLSGSKSSGSTACVAVISESSMTLANVGDSRAVMRRSEDAIQLTRDHKPSEQDELSRIREAGGVVVRTEDGADRVNGVLNMSRSLGDWSLRPAVSPVPEVYKYDLKGTERYVIFATDGVWDVVPNATAIHIIDNAIIRESQSRVTTRKQADRIAHSLVEAAVSRGSTDNITVLWVDLSSTGSRSRSHYDVRMSTPLAAGCCGSHG